MSLWITLLQTLDGTILHDSQCFTYLATSVYMYMYVTLEQAYCNVWLFVIHAEVVHCLDDRVKTIDIIRFESGMNIPIVKKLQPKLTELRSKAKFCLFKNRDHGIPIVRFVRYIDSWVKSENSVLPTWRNFLTILREISPDLCQIADQIEPLFDSSEKVYTCRCTCTLNLLCILCTLVCIVAKLWDNNWRLV